MYKVVFIRHGQSLWNKEGRFTGWVDAEITRKGLTDVDLTRRGINNAIKAGQILKEKGYEFDMAYTSYLERAIKTLQIILDQMNLMWIPVEKSWKLNEKHYGNLQGLYKKEMAEKVGEEQVFKWRRVYDVRPPKIKKTNKYYTPKDPRYKHLKKSEIPLTESLKDVVERVEPYWKKEIVPQIKKGKKVLISAHGNSLRAISKYLDNLKPEEVSNLNIPTGFPLVYEFDDKMRVKRHYYLGDKDKIEKATKGVKNQAKV